MHTELASGYRRSARRPGYEALVEDLPAGAADVVIIWKLDRLTRQGVRQIALLLDVLETLRRPRVLIANREDARRKTERHHAALAGST